MLTREWAEPWFLLLTVLGLVLLLVAAPVALVVTRAAALGWASYAGALALSALWLATTRGLEKLRERRLR